MSSYYLSFNVKGTVVDALIITLLARLIIEYLKPLVKIIFLKLYGFKYEKNQGIKAPKKLQSRYTKDNRNIRIKVLDNISILNLVIWLRKWESNLNK